MKKLTCLPLLALLIFSAPVWCQQKQLPATWNTFNHPLARQRASLWGEINAGYSNDGVMGRLSLNYRKGKVFVGASFYKSHICYHRNEKREFFLNIDNSQNHTTIASTALAFGMLFPGKCTPALSVGVSWLKFTYVSTLPVDENVTVDRIWETIAGEDYKEELLDAKSFSTLGIPVCLSLHLGAKHFTGLNVSLNANLNPHRILFSGAIGIDMGRLLSRKSQ